MIRIFLNGAAASAGGGLTYLRNVVPHLSHREDVQATVAISPKLRREFGAAPNLSFVDLDFSLNVVRRFWQEQRRLPGIIKRCAADILISAGNFALKNSPVPQILLSRNSLYTSADFYHDLRQRGDYGLWVDTKIKGFLAQCSITWADCTVAPSRAFASELTQWTGRPIIAIPHGFDAGAFSRDVSPLPKDILNKLTPASGIVRLLFVSHYNYYRNFETLLRAVPILCERLKPRDVQVVLTCKFRSGQNPGSYQTESAARLIRELDIAANIVELGAVPYHSLHQVYRACDVYVSPAYAESFAHPLVEAMSCGLPLAVSDLPVHREICGNAALYFQRFSPRELADAVLQASAADSKGRLVEAGRIQSLNYSWLQHVDQLLQFAGDLISKGKTS